MHRGIVLPHGLPRGHPRSPIVDEEQQDQVRLELREPTPADLVDSLSSTSSSSVTSTPATVSALSQEHVNALLSRLPPIKEDKEDMKEFFQREKTAPPAKTGKVEQQPFPPPVKQEKPAELLEEEKKQSESALTVLRYTPEGEVDNSVPYLSVTFSQPMIVLSSIDNVEKQSVPVHISPEPKNGGRFRWVGTQTLLYEPTYRFDMATDYKVKIDGNTKSVKGHKIEKEVSFTFSTPPAVLQNYYPHAGNDFPINEFPFFYLAFDQQVDPQKVLATVKVTADGAELSHKNEVLLSSSEKVKEFLQKSTLNRDKFSSEFYALQSRVDSAPEGRHVWFSIDKKVGLGKAVQLAVGPGVPSLEGPRLTKDAVTVQLKNYDQFKVVSHYPTSNILPLQSLSANFNNPLDLEVFDEKLVKITPEIANFEVVPNDRGITVRGKTKGRTTYTLHIDQKVKDIYGQSLDKDYELKFEVGPAGQTLSSFYSGLVVVDPTANEKPVFSVVSVNLKEFRAVVCQVKPEEYTDNLVPWGDEPLKPPGKVVFDEVVHVKEVEDDPVETQIELSKYLQFPEENIGQLFVFVEPAKGAWKNEYPPKRWAWLQITKLALDAFATVNEKALVWATSMTDGSPVADAKFSVGNITATGNQQGVAEMKVQKGTHGALICRHGNDVTFLRYIPVGEKNRDSFTSQTFSDRGLYKPSETVNIKGFVRDVKRTNEGATYDLAIPKKGEKLKYEVRDSRYQTILEGTTELTSFGSFSVSFPLPDNINLGRASVNFTRESRESFNADFDVQEFRTPEYSVKVSVPPRNYQVNGKAVVTTTASYYSGGGLGAATVNYIVTAENSHYSPPNWSDFKFQYVQPFWGCFFPRPSGATVRKEFEGRTDGNGEHLLCIEVQESERKDKVPVTVKAESSVQDINRQTISSSTSFLVHPSSLYVGLKTKKTFLLPGEKLSLDVIVTDIDGKAVKDVEVSFSITTTKVTRKGYKTVTTTPEVQKGSFRSSDKAVTQEMEIKEGGYFHAKLQLADSQGRVNETAVDFTVYGGETKTEVVASRVEAETLTLIPDKESYQIGDEAKILIQTPFSGPAEGLFTVCCSGPVHYERFSIKSGNSATISFPLKKEYAPNLSVNVTVVGQNSRKGSSHRPEGGAHQPNTRPAYAVGSTNIELPPNYSKLQVEVKPKDQYLAPGSSTEVEVFVKSADGKAVADSEVTLVIVDEAVLSLTNYSINSAMHFFTSHNFYARDERTRPYVVYKDWSTIAVEAPPQPVLYSAYDNFCCEKCCRCCACACDRCCECACCCCAAVGMGAPEEPPGPAIQVRSNFSPLAAYVPNAQTGSDGKVTVKVSLPDNLTRYRVTAVSVKEAAFCGVGESFIVAQLPVAIRPSLPRFLNFGDHADFCCVLQNQGDRSLTVHVAARSSNLALREPVKAGYSVVIPAMGRADLSFPMETVSAGIARFQIGAAVKTEGVSFSDAVEKEIRVFTPATSEAFATYGELEENAELQASFQPIQAPVDVFPQFGSLEISTSSTALQALTDAFLYLYNYEFDCNEQRASRLISIVALKDVLAAFKVSTLPSQEKLKSFISDSLGDLQKNQKADGTFGFWKGSSSTSPYVTVHVAHCYARCQLANYPVDANNLKSIVNALTRIEQYTVDALYAKQSRWSLQAYAAYVLALLNKSKESSELAHKVWKESGGIKGLPLEPLCWLAFALFKSNDNKATNEVRDVLKELQQKTNETAETANFVTSYGDNQANKLVMLHSNRRTDAIALEMLLYVDSKNSLITKVAKGLLAHRKRGRWGSTQENVFALLALEKYFHVREGKVPNFHANVWLGDEFAGEQQWSGRSIDTKQIKIPMSHLMEVEKKQTSTSPPPPPPPVKDLIISKKGEGRLYFRVGMTYAPRSLQSEPRDYGFMVERWYEGASKKEHVQKQSTGEWKIKAGELVRVHIRITNVSRRYQVAVVDMLPAGLEVLNPDLRTTGSLPQEDNQDSSVRCWWRRSWYEHQNLRDERVEAFTSLLWEGIHKYSYVARATSVGVYVVPPAKAEEMYSPEIFGRSASDRVVVVA